MNNISLVFNLLKNCLAIKSNNEYFVTNQEVDIMKETLKYYYGFFIGGCVLFLLGIIFLVFILRNKNKKKGDKK